MSLKLRGVVIASCSFPSVPMFRSGQSQRAGCWLPEDSSFFGARGVRGKCKKVHRQSTPISILDLFSTYVLLHAPRLESGKRLATEYLGVHSYKAVQSIIGRAKEKNVSFVTTNGADCF
eukprot:scaffold8456_cov103-Skeletonema_dohrnii-CCMP3373.AAC.2